jgi:hypothetical protein
MGQRFDAVVAAPFQRRSEAARWNLPPLLSRSRGEPLME